MAPAPLADEGAPGRRPAHVEQAGIHQRVVDDRVRAFEQPPALDGDQLQVAGPRADEVHDPCSRQLRLIRLCPLEVPRLAHPLDHLRVLRPEGAFELLTDLFRQGRTPSVRGHRQRQVPSPDDRRRDEVAQIRLVDRVEPDAERVRLVAHRAVHIRIGRRGVGQPAAGQVATPVGPPMQRDRAGVGALGQPLSHLRADQRDPRAGLQQRVDLPFSDRAAADDHDHLIVEAEEDRMRPAAPGIRAHRASPASIR